MKKATNTHASPFKILTAAYLALMLGAYLLYTGFSGYVGITEQKWRMYMLLTGGYAAGMLLLRLELVLVGAKNVPTLPKRHLRQWLPQLAALTYLGFTALSAALSPYQTTAFFGSDRREGLVTITLYCLSFLLVSVYGQAERWMLWVFAGAMSANCLLSVFQLAGYNPFGLYPEGLNYYDGNVLYAGQFLGTSGNVDILSALLSLAIPALLAAMVCLKERRTRLILLLPLALCTGVWLGSFVAGGILGVCGGAVLSLPVLAKRPAHRRRWLAAVAIALAAAAAAVYFFGDRMGGFLFEAHEVMHGRWEDSYGSGRIYIWRNVLPLVQERPLLGGGADTLGLRTDAAFERYDEALGITIRSAVDTAHNEYLNILINHGLPALLAYGTLLVSSAAKWIRRGSSDPVTALCGCAVLGYCIQAFFGISSPITTPYLWLALALLNGAETEKPLCLQKRKSDSCTSHT